MERNIHTYLIYCSFIVFIARVGYGHAPMYDNLRHEIDSFSTRMRGAFEKFGITLDKFDSRMELMNDSVSTSIEKFAESVIELGNSLTAQMNRSRERLKEMGNYTSRHFSQIEGEMQTMQRDSAQVKSRLEDCQEVTKDITKTMKEVKDDYEDFKKKTSSLWNISTNVTAVLHSVRKNKEEISRDISTLKGDLKSVISDALLPVETAIASLLSDISLIKKQVNKIGFTTDCPRGWKKFEDSCYLWVNKTTSWKLAKFTCKQVGGFMVEIYSEKESGFLKSFIHTKTSEIWTGASIGRKGIWYWTGSNSEIKLDIFKGDYPSGRSRAYCGAFVPKTLYLDDRNCGMNYSFVCRKFIF